MHCLRSLLAGGFTSNSPRMTHERIRDFLHAVPFVPFDVQLANGRILPVPHPDFASMSPTGRTMVIHTKNDGLEIVDVMLVTNVTVPSESAGRKRTTRR